MRDLKTFLLEEYDKDDKRSVLEDFADFLDRQLNSKFDPKTNRHYGSALWWAIGNGDGAYPDSRMTIGTKNTQLKNDADWRTLNFYVTDDGKLAAYLDAEDFELLNNTPAFEKKPLSGTKMMWSFPLGVTDEQLNKAFTGALLKIRTFFKDWAAADTITTDTIGQYSETDLERLDKLVDSRAEQEYVVWSDYDEEQLAEFNKELRQRRKQLTDLQSSKLANQYGAKKAQQLEEDPSTYLDNIRIIDGQIEDTNKRINKLKDEIKAMEVDKLRYMKKQQALKDLDATRRTSREQQLERDVMIKQLGLDMGAAAEFNNAQLADMIKRNKLLGVLEMTPEEAEGKSNEELDAMIHKKFTKTGKLRKQRTIKTGDIKDHEANTEENIRKEVKKKAKNFDINWDGFEF